MSDYYIFRDEKPDGPHTKSNLIELVASGKASRTEPCMSASRPEVQTVEDALNQPDRGKIMFRSLARGPESNTGKVAPALVRNRGVYIILGLLFGGLGFHNFYAGYNEQGAAQLIFGIIAGVISIFLPIFGGLVALGVMIWAVVDICTVTEDATGTPMA